MIHWVLPMENYYWYWRVGWTIRICFWLVLLLTAVALANCTSKGIQGTVNGTVVDPAIVLGRSTVLGTGTQLPQGGTDEKSDSTPTKPTD